MLRFLVLLAFCTVACMGIDMPAEKLEEYKKHFEKCKKEYPDVEVADLRTIMKEPKFDNKDIKCFLACMMQEDGIINKDGKFDKEKYLANIPQEIKDKKIEKIETTAAICEKEAEDSEDVCDLAAKLTECFMAHLKDE